VATTPIVDDLRIKCNYPIVEEVSMNWQLLHMLIIQYEHNWQPLPLLMILSHEHELANTKNIIAIRSNRQPSH
jgi:hypothetical protein